MYRKLYTVELKKVFNVNPDGRKRRERSWKGCFEGVEEDLNRLKVRQWRTQAQNRDDWCWRPGLWKGCSAEVHHHVYAV